METPKELISALKFLENIDELKTTYRQCLVMNGERPESTAEHSFSLAMAVLLLSSFSEQKIDLYKSLKMALFHDLAEAVLGDTFHYEKSSSKNQKSEEAALRELLAPIAESKLADEILDLWQEFEFGSSEEAIFLRGVDRFLPMFHNYKTEGYSWVKHGITKQMALEKNSHIEQASGELWKFTQEMLDKSQSRGWIG